jgi:hypothetical protein
MQSSDSSNLSSDQPLTESFDLGLVDIQVINEVAIIKAVLTNRTDVTLCYWDLGQGALGVEIKSPDGRRFTSRLLKNLALDAGFAS